MFKAFAVKISSMQDLFFENLKLNSTKKSNFSHSNLQRDSVFLDDIYHCIEFHPENFMFVFFRILWKM